MIYIRIYASNNLYYRCTGPMNSNPSMNSMVMITGLGVYPRYDLEDPDLEAVWIETRQNGKSLIIGTIYIPPPDENPKALMALDRVLHFLGPEQSVLLTGDPNCRNLAWEKWHHLVPNQNYYAWKRGTWLLNLADKHGLSIANDGRYTRFEK